MRFPVLLFACAALAGCEQSDVGNACPELLVDDPTLDGSTATTEEVVAQDVRFPCDDLICVSTAGRPGYCTKKCRDDASCPAGFECREVQPVGAFAGQKLCVWKACERVGDCGSKEEFCCVVVPAADPSGAEHYCDFKQDGTCG